MIGLPIRSKLSGLVSGFEDLAGATFEIQPIILMGLRASHRSDPLHEIVERCGRMSFLGENDCDHFQRIVFGESAIAQKRGPILFASRHSRARGLDAIDEARRRRVRELGERSA
jgi:hypothetical protein